MGGAVGTRLGVEPGHEIKPATGLAELDGVLGGLHWGENIVWTAENGTAPDDLVRSLIVAAGRGGAYDRRLVVGVSRSQAKKDFSSKFEVLPSMRDLLASDHAADETEGAGERVFVAIDLAKAKDDELDPRLLKEVAVNTIRRGWITYWFLSARTRGHDVVAELSQCLIKVGEANLSLERADARGPGAEGTLLRYEIGDDGFRLLPIAATGRLSRGLSSIRKERGWSQAELARVAGVSPSAISQAERGQHGLSLDTLLELSSKLGITIDELLHGRPRSYRVHRARGSSMEASRVMVDDAASNLKAILLHLPARATAALASDSARTDLLLVGDGTVQAILPGGRPSLNQGDVLQISDGRLISCRNIGEEDAFVFLIGDKST